MKTYPLAFLSSFLIAPPAFGSAVADLEESRRGLAPEYLPELVQLAQAYEFDVYIDQYGREVVVDPHTGQVVEIRAPLAEPRPIVPPGGRLRESGPRDYDFTDPRDVERFHRDREAAINRGWGGYEPPYGEPDYPPPGGGDPYGGPDYGGYEELPPSVEPGYESYPPVLQDRSVRRAPLEAPSDREMASVPPDRGSGGLEPGGGELRRTLPQAPEIKVPGARGASENVAAFQVLLDRAGASPGVIDGRIGDNVNKATDAYYEITGQRLRPYDQEWIEAEMERTGGPAFMDYTITPEDAAGPYVASVPEDYGEKAKLERLSFTRVSENLAERFHMDEKYLIELNPGANFNRPGTVVRVVNPGKPATDSVARIIADKSQKQVRAYDERGGLVAAYPATIGSGDTPSPTGTHGVSRVALDPNYTYDPRKNFKQGENERVLTIPPGPNGPVGSVWIALSKPTYGIHGTPDPSRIGKSFSHGCVRLTNWDAGELAKLVKPGVEVEFVE